MCCLAANCLWCLFTLKDVKDVRDSVPASLYPSSLPYRVEATLHIITKKPEPDSKQTVNHCLPLSFHWLYKKKRLQMIAVMLACLTIRSRESRWARKMTPCACTIKWNSNETYGKETQSDIQMIYPGSIISVLFSFFLFIYHIFSTVQYAWWINWIRTASIKPLIDGWKLWNPKQTYLNLLENKEAVL